MTTTREHGTRAKYVNEACRCGPCTASNTRYQADYAAGEFGTLNAAPVRAHLEHLLANGWTVTDLARRTGYSEAGLFHIRRRGHRVKRQTALDLLTFNEPAPITRRPL